MEGWFGDGCEGVKKERSMKKINVVVGREDT